MASSKAMSTGPLNGCSQGGTRGSRGATQVPSGASIAGLSVQRKMPRPRICPGLPTVSASAAPKAGSSRSPCSARTAAAVFVGTASTVLRPSLIPSTGRTLPSQPGFSRCATPMTSSVARGGQEPSQVRRC